MLAAADPSVLKSDYNLPPDYEIMTETAEVFTKALLLGMAPEAGKDNFADDVEILPFEEAVAYMRKRLPVDGKTYYALADKMRYRAFTVSRLADGDAVRQVQSMLTKAMDEGSGIQQFLQLTEGQLADAAGMGRGAGWYYETVYRTNTATAYNVGRAIGFEETPPIALELIGIDDARQTETCHALTVPPFRRPYGDPVWEQMWPPFHFNCRTTVRAIYDESEIDDAGGADEFYSNGTPDYTPDKGFGAYPLDKTDTWWDLTDSMKDRAGEYGLDVEFMEARKRLIESENAGPNDPLEDAAKQPETEDVISRMATGEVVNDLQHVTHIGSVGIPDVNNEVSKGIYNSIKDVYDRYPVLDGKIISIGQNEHGKDVLASIYENTGELNLNIEFFGKTAKSMKAKYEKWVEDGVFPKGTTWQSAINHEIGHLVDRHITLIERENPDRGKILRTNFSTELRRTVMKELGVKPENYSQYISDGLSSRAAKDAGEFLAEAFSEFTTSPKPRKIAETAGRIIERYLKGEINYGGN